MFTNLNLKPTDIDKIIVVNGPGSFTGIRIGITIAKVYAWGLNKDITTISSLEAMAISCEDKKLKIPVLDARRDYVYAAIFDEKNNILLKNCHIKLEQLEKEIEKLNKECTIITNDDINTKYDKKTYKPNILKIVDRYKNKQSINPHLVNPEYLKLTEAEEKNDRRS